MTSLSVPASSDTSEKTPQREMQSKTEFADKRYFHIRKSIKNIGQSSTNELDHRMEIKMTQMKQRKGKQCGN